MHDLLKLIDLLQNAQIVTFNLQEIQQASILAEFAVEWRYNIDDAPG